MELAGIQLNESVNMESLVAEHISDIIIKTIKNDNFFKDMTDGEIEHHIREMVAEQFTVLRDDLSPQIVENIKLTLGI